MERNIDAINLNKIQEESGVPRQAPRRGRPRFAGSADQRQLRATLGGALLGGTESARGGGNARKNTTRNPEQRKIRQGG